MSTATTPSAVPNMPAGEPPLWPISVAMYAEMIAQGILKEQDRVYLWRGRLAPIMTKHRPHCLAVKNTYDRLYDLRLAGYTVEQETPLALRREPSVPEPDVKVLRGRSEDYATTFPTSADVALVIEVAESSLTDDRRLAEVYAAEGIPVYWIVNLPERRLEVYTEPIDRSYCQKAEFGPDDAVPVILDGREVGRITVRDLLPPGDPR